MGRRQSLAGPAALMAAGRVVNIGLGVAMVPLLIHYLRGEGFAVWAILLSCAVAFSALDFGLPFAIMRHVALAWGRNDNQEASNLVSTAAALLVGGYVLMGPLAALASSWLGAVASIPSGRWSSGGDLIALTFLAVGVRSVLLLGTHVLFAARQFRAVATLALFQAFSSNVAATIAAAISRELDIVFLSYWCAQIAVCSVGAYLAWRHLRGHIGVAMANLATARRLVKYGLKVQLQEWAQTVNFQFDKFVILKAIGFSGVASYEVANRSLLALRSVPAAGMDTFLPAAVVEASARPPGEWYRRATTIAAYSVCVFILAPLAIAPVFLYAWVGELGYVTRWAFAALALGCAASLMVTPAGTLVQALDRPGIQGRAAVLSMCLNVPLSLGLVGVWGVEGAALGTATAMVMGASVLMRDAHREAGLRLSETLRAVASSHWPMWVVCLVLGVVTHWAFDRWFLATDPSIRYSVSFRLNALAASVTLYALCVGLMLAAKVAIVGLDMTERRRVVALRGAALRTWRSWAVAH